MADSPERRMVLLVDPHEDHRNLYGDWFWSQGFDVVTTSSGRMAIAIAAAYDPDLVVTELNLPDMNGIVMERRLREARTTQHVPVLIVTACARPQILNAAPGEQTDLLPKLDFDRLLSQIRRLPPRYRVSHERDASHRRPTLAAILNGIDAPPRS